MAAAGTIDRVGRDLVDVPKVRVEVEIWCEDVRHESVSRALPFGDGTFSKLANGGEFSEGVGYAALDVRDGIRAFSPQIS